MKRLKEEKGSITLFVLVSMLFFVLFLAGMYMLSNAKEQTGISETGKIKQIYEKDVNNIADVYATELRKYTIADILKAGDYIKYDSGKNGIILCRVLYDANSEYGLQIISDKNVKNVTLGVAGNYSSSVTSYNNAIEDLNEYAEEYINKEYAYDARSVGSAPTISNGMFVNKDKIKFEGATEYLVPTTENYETLQFENANYINSYETDNNYETDKTQMQRAGLWITEETYWLASRVVAANSSNCDFCVRYVIASNALSGDLLCRVYSSGQVFGDSREHGFRPCISLKYDKIKIVSGDGKSADTAYVIGK